MFFTLTKSLKKKNLFVPIIRKSIFAKEEVEEEVEEEERYLDYTSSQHFV